MLRSILTSSLLLPISAFAGLLEREGCTSGYNLCAPQGVTRESLGPVGPDWANLFQNIIETTSTAPQQSELGAMSKRAVGFCCAETTQCLSIDDQGGTIAMCWDRFTTDVYFRDGTFGTVVTGNFTTSDGGSVNLIYGDYTLKDGQTGNIYANSSLTSAIDTTTMPMPTPWTSNGIGSAIPATELGTTAELSTITSVIAATTIAATTPMITIVATSDCNHCFISNTTITGPTQAGTTRPASTSVFITGIITPPIRGAASKRTTIVDTTALSALISLMLLLTN